MPISEVDLKESTPRQASDSDDEFLARLGARVREARLRRGLTRKSLAQDSSVSERYLAHLESGQGNVSILLLRQIAAALHTAPEELLREPVHEPVEFALIRDLLERLPRRKLAEVHSRLMREYGDAGEQRRRRIALIGLRGAGKSTLGQRLARARGVPFIELDREIEREAGTSLSEIFLLYGQPGYRRYERRCLENVIEKCASAVIATGGSIVSDPSTYDLLLSTCFTVWLKARPEEHMARVIAQGDMRPMAGNDQAMADLRRILSSREALYAQADLTLDTAGKSVEQSFAELCRALAAEEETR